MRLRHYAAYDAQPGSRADLREKLRRLFIFMLDHKRDMHEFHELVQRSTAFSLNALDEAQQRTIDALQTSAATTLVKTLQMVHDLDDESFEVRLEFFIASESSVVESRFMES